jgi:hypothetical protein
LSRLKGAKLSLDILAVASRRRIAPPVGCVPSLHEAAQRVRCHDLPDACIASCGAGDAFGDQSIKGEESNPVT